MRMADIIKESTKSNAGKKRFKYDQYLEKDKDDALQMKRLNAPDRPFADKDSSLEELYQKYLREMRLVFNRAVISFDILPPQNHIKNLAMEAAGKLQLSSGNIMDFFMRSEPKEEDYLLSHTVNVTFLAVMIGVWLNYNKSQLCQLATASMFHDIGMLNVLDIAQLPRRLKPQEREKIQRHAEYSKDFLAQIEGMDDKVIEAVSSHHKRLGDSSQSISDYSQIIGLADTFEAMTHERVYREAEEPHSVIRTIIENQRSKFDSKIIKALVDNIGIYPAGTFVRLDTDEIGVVIDVNQGSPLSPKVNILFDKQINRLTEPRTVDLSKQTNIHIKNPLDKETLQLIKRRHLK